MPHRFRWFEHSVFLPQQEVEARVLRAALARALAEAVVHPAGVALAVARVPADLLAKGRRPCRTRDGLVLAEALGDGHADALVRDALEPALADGHDARADLLAHVDLERGALDAGRRRRRAHGVVEVRRLRARRRRRRGGRGHREQARGLLGVARLEVRVHVRARAEARGDQDAPALALAVDERARVLGGPVHVHVARVGVGARAPEGHDALLACESQHGHRLDDRARQRQPARAGRRVVHVGHLRGHRGRVGVRDQPRIIPRTGQADAKRIVEPGRVAEHWRSDSIWRV